MVAVTKRILKRDVQSKLYTEKQSLRFHADLANPKKLNRSSASFTIDYHKIWKIPPLDVDSVIYFFKVFFQISFQQIFLSEKDQRIRIKSASRTIRERINLN